MKLIKAQLKKELSNRGLVVWTFWADHKATCMDAFGNRSTIRYNNIAEMRDGYRYMKSKGYSPVA